MQVSIVDLTPFTECENTARNGIWPGYMICRQAAETSKPTQNGCHKSLYTEGYDKEESQHLLGRWFDEQKNWSFY